jgi:hypothetical protein
MAWIVSIRLGIWDWRPPARIMPAVSRVLAKNRQPQKQGHYKRDLSVDQCCGALAAVHKPVMRGSCGAAGRGARHKRDLLDVGQNAIQLVQGVIGDHEATTTTVTRLNLDLGP